VPLSQKAVEQFDHDQKRIAVEARQVSFLRRREPESILKRCHIQRAAVVYIRQSKAGRA
jgi:hypothetical protein